MKKALVALTMFVASGSVFAAEEASGAYVSGSIGKSMIDTEADEDIGFKFAAGYALSKNFAIEGGWAHTSASDSAYDMEAELAVNSLYAAAVASIPVGEAFSLHGKLGVSLNLMKVEFSAPGFSISDSDNEADLMYGFGGAYKFNSNVSLIAEYEQFEDDIGLLSAGLRYNF